MTPELFALVAGGFANTVDGPAVIVGVFAGLVTTLPPEETNASGTGTQNAGKAWPFTASVPIGAAWSSRVLGATSFAEMGEGR